MDKKVILDNDKIRIFAATAAFQNNDEVIPLQPLYDDFKDNKPFTLYVLYQFWEI